MSLINITTTINWINERNHKKNIQWKTNKKGNVKIIRKEKKLTDFITKSFPQSLLYI